MMTLLEQAEQAVRDASPALFDEEVTAIARAVLMATIAFVPGVHDYE